MDCCKGIPNLYALVIYTYMSVPILHVSHLRQEVVAEGLLDLVPLDPHMQVDVYLYMYIYTLYIYTFCIYTLYIYIYIIYHYVYIFIYTHYTLYIYIHILYTYIIIYTIYISISADPGRCKGERVREEDGRKGVPFPPVT